MIENNIIQSLGAGSGIDSKNIVKQLTEIERAAPQQRIDKKRDHAEAQISDFGSLASAMDTMKASITALSEREGMYSKNASFTESDALVPTKLDTTVPAGSYSFEVQSVARSQSLSFAGFDDPKSAVGEGTLTFNFGDWTRVNDPGGPTDGDPISFNLDPEAESFSITIDSTNDSLEGLRDAINKADKGVQASIIFDGSTHRLVVSAPSGATNELEITASEAAGGADNTDNLGLSRFAHNANIANFADTETQTGSDAVLLVNGLTVSRETNTIDDVVPGLTLDVLKEAPGETINITISDDKAFAEENVRAFVDSYNAFLEEIKPLFKYNEEEERDGSLKNDPLAKSVLSQFRGNIAAEVPGLANTDYTSLATIGIRTELDGTLSISETDFRKAFDNNFASVQKLFAADTSTSSTDISINSYGKNTQPGNYDVQITTSPAKGYYNGQAIDETAVVFPDFAPAGRDYSLTVDVNGTSSGNIVIPTDVTYATIEDLASAIEAAVNADKTLAASGAAVNVTAVYDPATMTHSFDLTSTRYGSSSVVNITSASVAASGELGLTVASGTAGVNVAGTIDGVAGFGLGNVLLPKLGEPAEGLSLIIGENATSATANFSRGFAGQMEESMNGFLKRNGLFDKRETVLETRIDNLDDDEKNLDRRMSAYEDRLMRQFIAMESILNSLNSTGGFLENLVDTLPFTASRK